MIHTNLNYKKVSRALIYKGNISLVHRWCYGYRAGVSPRDYESYPLAELNGYGLPLFR